METSLQQIIKITGQYVHTKEYITNKSLKFKWDKFFCIDGLELNRFYRLYYESKKIKNILYNVIEMAVYMDKTPFNPLTNFRLSIEEEKKEFKINRKLYNLEKKHLWPK